MKKLLLLLFIPIGIFAQDDYYYTNKNDDGKYGLLHHNPGTGRTDTVVPYEYQDIWRADSYFVLIESDFTEYKDGEEWGKYYKGRVIDKELNEIRNFDTIKKLPYLSSPDHRTFKFKEAGKEGFFSGAFKGKPWTEMYDEIDITRQRGKGTLKSTIEVAGYKKKRCGIIARNGELKTLIGPLGDTIVQFTKEDSISIWSLRYFEVTHNDNGASDLYTPEGKLIESDITSKKFAYGPGSTIYVFSHLDGTQSLWTGYGQRTPPIPYKLNFNTLDEDKYIVGVNDKGEYYKLTWQGEVISGPYEGHLKLFDTENEAIKESGVWRLSGKDVSKYQDIVFDSVATLTSGRSLRNYAFYSKGETVIISVGAKPNRRSKSRFWSAKVKGNNIKVVDGSMIAETDGFWALLTDDGMTEFIFDKFESLPNSYKFLKARVNDNAVLVDGQGNVFFKNLNLRDIEAHNCEVGPMYELIGEEGVGYYVHGMEEDKVELVYDDLECGYFGFCVKKGRKWGLIDFDRNQVLDFKYRLKKVRDYIPDNE